MGLACCPAPPSSSAGPVSTLPCGWASTLTLSWATYLVGSTSCYEPYLFIIELETS